MNPRTSKRTLQLRNPKGAAMKITRSVTVALVGVAAVSGSFLLSQALADPSSPPRPSPAASTPQHSSADISIRAASLAGLAQRCLAGRQNADAHARYETTAAANPTVAQQISADCSPVIVQP